MKEEEKKRRQNIADNLYNVNFINRIESICCYDIPDTDKIIIILNKIQKWRSK